MLKTAWESYVIIELEKANRAWEFTKVKRAWESYVSSKTLLNQKCTYIYIYPAYFSKHNSNCEKQVILLMISNGDNGIIFQSKKLSTLLRGETTAYHDGFYCLNYPSFWHRKKKLITQKSMWK